MCLRLKRYNRVVIATFPSMEGACRLRPGNLPWCVSAWKFDPPELGDRRPLFIRAYPREAQEMVFDAHERAFAFFRGACTPASTTT